MVSDIVLRNDIGALEQIAAEVAKGLAYAKTVGSDVYVQTPVTFPSGRNVGLKLLGGPLEFTITDDGLAMREAELMGAEDICRREAKKIAKEFDLHFNDWELFEVQAPLDRLVGLTSLVANAVGLALIRTCDKFAERFETRRRDDLAARLSRVFGERKVTKNADFNGAARIWNFDARVDLPSGRPGLFSIVSPSPISVAFAYSKLDDVSRLERPPFLAAVLEHGLDAGDKALLSRPARKLFLVTDSDDEFKQAA
jgi:hypothetical protein